MNPEDYISLVTGWHRDKPKFTATVTATVEPFVNVYNEALALYAKFDLDTALGPQLDIDGELIGVSRSIPIPLPGIYFAWDDPARGWDRGMWKGPYDTAYGISRLDDETYRRLLKAKVQANSWDGTIEGAQAILDVFFTDPATHVFVHDTALSSYPGYFFAWDDPNRGWDTGLWYETGISTTNVVSFDMVMVIGVSGKWPSPTDLAILGRSLIPLKPEGIRLEHRVASVENTSVFGYDLDNEFVAGWDQGSWGVTPEYILEHI